MGADLNFPPAAKLPTNKILQIAKSFIKVRFFAN